MKTMSGAIFERVSTTAGPEAQRLAVDARKENILRIEWDPGGRCMSDPLKCRPDGIYITDDRTGTVLFLSRTRLADLARTELKKDEKEEERCETRI